MATNFTLALPVDAGSINTRQPVLNGAALDTLDQDPTGAWAEVVFAALATPRPGVSGVLCHISTDAALYFLVAAAVPTTQVGSQVQAGGEKTIGIDAGLKLWIK